MPLNSLIFDNDWEMIQIKQIKRSKSGAWDVYIMVNSTWHIGRGDTLSEAIEEAEENIRERKAFRVKHGLEKKPEKIEDIF